MLAEVRPTTSFVYYEGGRAVTVTPREPLRVPKPFADRLVAAGLAERAEPEGAPENKAEGDAPEVKAAKKATARRTKKAAPKP